MSLSPETRAAADARPRDVPGELWMLWHGSGWVVSVDDAPGGETFLASTSHASALAAALHQLDNYGVDCLPVRVK